MRLRKNYRALTADERDRFVRALHKAKERGTIDQFAKDHEKHFHAAHHSSHFPPWHREFLRRFEDSLLTNEADIAIPYWNSTVDTSTSDPLWDTAFMGQFDTSWELRRTLGRARLPTPAAVQNALRLTTYDAFWTTLERPIHAPPHNWIGGVMATAASPGDPVFFLHHSWIDLLWAQWQLLHPGMDFVSSEPGKGLNDEMKPWPATPANVLDHLAINRYEYPDGFQRDPP